VVTAKNQWSKYGDFKKKFDEIWQLWAILSKTILSTSHSPNVFFLVAKWQNFATWVKLQHARLWGHSEPAPTNPP
jgi:hypothetical protein